MCNLRNAIAASKLKPSSPPDAKCTTCPKDTREYFVIHSTAGYMSEQSIKKHTALDDVEAWKKAEAVRKAAEQAAGEPATPKPQASKPPPKPPEAKRSKAHVYVNPDGTTLWIWPFTEKNVWATKAESRSDVGKQRMVHVELNYGAPDAPTDKQYETLADLYIEACQVTGNTLIIVPHIEVDRGLADGHSDPELFDYNKFYEVLTTKGVAIENVQRFDHDRYWGKPTYKIPWANDTFSFPPVLTGDPHAGGAKK